MTTEVTLADYRLTDDLFVEVELEASELHEGCFWITARSSLNYGPLVERVRRGLEAMLGLPEGLAEHDLKTTVHSFHQARSWLTSWQAYVPRKR